MKILEDIKSFFIQKNQIKTLSNEVVVLKKELEECSEKLIEKQEHINKTNAYWKRKFHELKQKKKKL